MKIQNAYCLILLASSLTIAGCTTTSQNAATQNPNAYSGMWPSNDPASVEIISEDPLTVSYCYKAKCEAFKPVGTVENMTVVFPINSRRKGASLNLVRNELSYKATYTERGGGRTWKATFTKPALTPAQ